MKTNKKAIGLNPLHCGAVVASRFGLPAQLDLLLCLNPLHCGAVVASPAARRARAKGWGVSIPFIAGQWSLQVRRAMQALHLAGLNPLHCGAVVASTQERHGDRGGGAWSQSPSLRGSGRFGQRRRRDNDDSDLSQSPSLRGSGRFKMVLIFPPCPPPCLNPLHCGAVVASRRMAGVGRRAARLNPLHCGAVVASRKKRPQPTTGRCLNPLHCGAVVASGRRPCRPRILPRSQSPSLRGSGRFIVAYLRNEPVHACLNPLHCGAVVASPRLHIVQDQQQGLNPLHCGAVVASF